MWTKPARRRFRDMFVACNNPRERNLLILQLFAALWIAKVSWHFVALNILRGLNFVTSLILREDWRDRRPSQIPPACGASAYHRAWRLFLVDVAPRCRASGAYFRLPIFCAGTHLAIASMAHWIAIRANIHVTDRAYGSKMVCVLILKIPGAICPHGDLSTLDHPPCAEACIMSKV